MLTGSGHQALHAAQALTYQDEDGARKDDIASLKVDQADFKVFYDKVKELKDYYRNKPIEVTEVSHMLQQAFTWCTYPNARCIGPCTSQQWDSFSQTCMLLI